jgi:acyl carrier protein
VEDSLEYNSIPEWDSVAHMKMVAAIETAFDIMLDTEDIIDMSSFRRVKEILGKYGVEC